MPNSIELNKAQREAVEHDAGPLLVLAGPGTGKTRVIIARILRMIEEGHDPAEILAVTFSVKATNEMRERLAAWAGPLGDKAARVTISTFHSLGRRLTQRFGDTLGLKPELTLMDSAHGKRTLRALIARLNLFPHLRAVGCDNVISEHLRFEASCKHSARTPADAVRFARRRLEEARDASGTPDERAAARLSAETFHDHARLFEAFDASCIDRGVITFDDFLAYPLRIFARRPELASFVRAETRRVVVDEFQDVNPAQIELLRHIAPNSPTADLCVVGDDDQAIYAFRGSDPAAVRAFTDHWPGHRTVALTENHRCGPAILRVADTVIRRASSRVAPDKVITYAGPADAPAAKATVEGCTVPTDDDHGAAIAAIILADKSEHPERPWSSYAVLVRGGGQLDKCAASLQLAGIPIDLRREPPPSTDQSVQDLLAWIAVLAGRADASNVHRLLVRPPHLIAHETVQAWREEHARGSRSPAPRPSFTDWLRTSRADHPGVAAYLSTLDELVRSTALVRADEAAEHIIRAAGLSGVDSPEPHDPESVAARSRALVAAVRFIRTRQPMLDPPGGLGAFLSYYNDLDKEEQEFRAPSSDQVDGAEAPEGADAVAVLTAHRAKGLEWDTVFVVKVQAGNGGFSAGGSGREDAGDAALPPEFTGRPPLSEADEERRVFYVACTRAKRRLVLTAKNKKTWDNPDDFFADLTRREPKLEVPVRTFDEVIAAAPSPPPGELERVMAERLGPPRRAELLRREETAVRQAALAALTEASSPVGADAPGLTARLDDAASAALAVGRLRSGRPDEAAALLGAGPACGRVRELIERLRHSADAPLWPPPPAPLTLSFTQLEAFLKCPRCWYLRYVLDLAPIEHRSASLGAAIHEALRRFYEMVRDADATGAAPPASELHALADREFEKVFSALDPEAELQRARMHAQLDTLLEHQHPTTHQVIALEQAITFPFADSAGRTHRLFAKIDRLDLAPDGTHRLIDYKTGHATKKLHSPDKGDLQLGIYALALAHQVAGHDSVNPDIPPGVCEYWLLSTGQRGVISFADLNLKKTREVIAKATSDMLTPPYAAGDKCEGHCTLIAWD